MLNISTLIQLIVALPLISAIVTAVLGPRVLRNLSHWPTIVALVTSFILSLTLGWQVRQAVIDRAENPTGVGFEQTVDLWTWASVPQAFSFADDTNPDAAGAAPESRSFDVTVTLRVDTLNTIMLIMVTMIASLVAIYAQGYMHGDRGYWRFFAYVSLFVFSMTMLVSVSNFLLLYVFWEAVGVCSYLLIGFWYEKPEAAAAGKKAFLVNRVGDFGFALALFLIWTSYGTLNFHDTASVPGVLGQTRLMGQLAFVGGGIGIAICVLLLVGACGKSAQFPLHVWLPDAMEGPTPVSALIHAATMVTAGIYMVTRCTPLFVAAPDAQLVVASIGGITALMAGLIAITQYDLKRVLAYSTVSQLGYMFLGLGTGTIAGISAGMFHLFTHAFFKALLFLGAGSVMHAMGGVIDMRRFGGLRKLMPITHWTFACGCLALAGFFPFSGFWSKDAIVGSVHEQAHLAQVEIEHREQAALQGGQPDWLVSAELLPVAADHGSDHGHAGEAPSTAYLQELTMGQLRCRQQVYTLLYYVGLFTAFLTAIYTFRAFFMTFYGKEVIPEEAGHHAHESPPSMWVPLSILSAFALAVGYLAERDHVFAAFLSHTPSLAYSGIQATPHPSFHMNVAMISSIIAIVGIGIAAFIYLGDRREANALARWMDNGRIGRLVGMEWSPYRLSQNKFYFDEIYQWTIVRPLQALASVSYFVDRWIVDGLVNLCGWLPRVAGVLLRGLQMGLVSFYGLAMTLGVLTLVVAWVIWGGG
jgi:NADH-quinone oxidoreductase subunit L